MKRVAVLMCGVLLVGQTGCSFFGSSTERVTVTCTDPEAELFFNGVRIGKGSAVVDVPRSAWSEKGAFASFAAVNGDRVGYRDVGYRISTLGTLDMIGTWLLFVPFFGLFAPASRKLATDTVVIPMPNVTVIKGKRDH